MKIYYVGENSLFEEFERATIEDCYNYLKTLDVVSLDIETTQKFGGKYNKEGLDPYVSRIVMVQVGDLDRQYVIDYRCISIKPILPIFTDPSIVLVGTNLKFEYVHLLHNENIRINNLFDVRIAELVLYNGLNPDASLKGLMLKYFEDSIEKDTRMEFVTIGSKPFTKRQIEYGAEDIIYPLIIKAKQEKEIPHLTILNCINLEMLFTEVLGAIEYKGIHFDTERWEETYVKNHKLQLECLEKLNNFVIFNYPTSRYIEKQLDLFSSMTKCNINWKSPKQVTEFFYYLGICPRNDDNNLTVNSNVVKASLTGQNKDISDHLREFILLYLQYKELDRACSTFGIDFFKYINPITKRLHSNYTQILSTGRISSSGPNLQNIPSNDSFRRAFTAPKGYKIVNADYSGQEQIILVNNSQDKDLISFYEKNLGDMHSFVASKIFPELANLSLDDIKKHHKDKRQIAKGAGFAINYGGTGFTISQNLGIPLEEGEAVYNAYFKAFPGLKSYFQKVQQLSLKRGFIEIDEITGRKYFFKRPKSNKERGEIQRAALNYPIQGQAGSITKYAAILFYKWILENNLQDVVAITNLVHDEINIEVIEEKAALVAENLEKCMQKSADLWCLTVKLKADAVITNYWTH